MGSVWLSDLPDVVEATGLDWAVYDGWETRGRSSGGYDAVYAVFCHHTASNTAPASDMSYMWEGSPDRPVGAIYLARTGKVTIGAAGATNTQGKGGPWNLSRGTIPLDKGNAYGIAIEAANAGTGEPWPDNQCSAYVVLVGALCDAYGLDTNRDVLSHNEWVQPSCPGRKIDPAGPSPWAASGTWDMDLFRRDVCADDTTPPQPPPDDEEDEMPALLIKAGSGSATQGAIAVVDLALTQKRWLQATDPNALLATGFYGTTIVTLDGRTFDAIPSD